MDKNDLGRLVEDIARNAMKASLSLRTLGTTDKNRALSAMAEAIEEARREISEANKKDLADAQKNNLSSAMKDRLELTEKRFMGLSKTLKEIALLPDPVGEIIMGKTLPNGMKLLKEKIPLGTVGVIFESRPNVTVDIGALCLKSGNAVVLKGGHEAIHTNRALAAAIQKGLEKTGIPPAAISLIPETDRAVVLSLLKQEQYLDIIVPRGGEELIRFVSDNTRIPVIKHDKGLCHLYVDKDADPEKAVELALDTKVNCPGVCNAVESIIFHDKFEMRKQVLLSLIKRGVEVRGDILIRKDFPEVKEATAEDYDTEYLDLIISASVVTSINAAVKHIRDHGSGHSEAIVSENDTALKYFEENVDAAALFFNCSTRFHDGGEFGFGAEIGISNSKLHVRGPMGLADLTTTRYLVKGTGQVRGKT